VKENNMDNTKVFSKFKTKHVGLFKDIAVLSKGYYPSKFEEIPHRNREIEQFKALLGKAMRNNVPDNIFVYGKTGTGKTMLSRLITKQLSLEASEINIPVKSCYINCETVRSDTEVIKTLNRLILDDESSIKGGVSLTSHFNVFCRLINLFKGILIIIFDEVDKLKNPDLINVFSRIKENGYSEKNVCIIGITNDLNFVNNLNPRTKSSLAQSEIVFYPYDALQLGDILRFRAKQAFKEGIIGDAVIALCAAYSAQEHGDARKAMDILRVSGEIAESRGCNRVTDIHVKEARNRIERDKMTEVIGTLPMQTKFTLASCVIETMKTTKPVITGMVYLTYKELAKKAGIDVLTQRRVTDLISELDMLGVITAKSLSKGKYGRTRQISLNADPEVVVPLLEDSTYLSRYDWNLLNRTL
jgi:cell division control protein 6